MSSDRFSLVVANARRAPLQLAGLMFFTMVGVSTVLDLLGMQIGAGTLERVAVSALGAALFVFILRHLRR